MTAVLLMLGDSLIDSGNVSRASDGPVLGEQIALAMGGDPADQQLFPMDNSPVPSLAQLHNYAQGGAESGRSPRLEGESGSVSTGFRAQVKAVRRHADFYRQTRDVDALICAGANDVLSLLDEMDRLASVLETPERSDDRRLLRSTARSITRNLRRGVDRLTGLVDEVVLVGAYPLTATPLVQDLVDDLDPRSADRLLTLVEGIGRKVQKRLERRYDLNSSVFVIDLQQGWDAIPEPSFVDEVHPSSVASAQLASVVLDAVKGELSSFGFDVA